jgi:hypothetical protein
MNKLSGILAAAIILGTVSITAAATRYYTSAASGTAAAERFQGHWNVGY